MYFVKKKLIMEEKNKNQSYLKLLSKILSST